MGILKKCKNCGKSVILSPLTARGFCRSCHASLRQILRQSEKLEASLERWHADRGRRAVMDGWTPIRGDVKGQAASKGLVLFQMRGPVDANTSEICLRYVGQTKTAEEWERIAPHAFSEGLHGRGCRHFFDPVRSLDSPSVLEYQEFAQMQVTRVRKGKERS